MKNMFFVATLIGCFCLTGCDSKPEVKAPDKDKITDQPVFSSSGGDGGQGGSSSMVEQDKVD